MKKYAWMLALALPMSVAFTSCGDDEEEGITLDQTSLSINYESTATLKASEKNGVWASSDEFVASVDDKGVVTAKHVGEAIITVSKDGNSASCKVTVNPTDNTYTLPIMTWGASMTAVENSVSGLVKDNANCDENTLFYGTGTKDGYPWYTYLFESNKLASSSFTVELDADLNAIDDVWDFLDQYYKQTSNDAENLITYYANAETVSGATVIVKLMPDKDFSNYSAIFTPKTTSTRATDIESTFDKHMEVINNRKK